MYRVPKDKHATQVRTGLSIIKLKGYRTTSSAKSVLTCRPHGQLAKVLPSERC